MGKKKKKPLVIGNRYVFTNPITDTHISITPSMGGKSIRFFIYIGRSQHQFTLTREEAAQLARDVHLLLDDTEVIE